jgi:hypothetical protein
MKRSVMVLAGVCVVIFASATDARAQMTMGTFKGYLTGHIGMLAGGNVDNERMVAGASIAVHESNGWGAEIDFGRSTEVTANRQLLDLTSYFVNATMLKPRGLVRPFGLAGAGIIQADGCTSQCAASIRTHDFGITLGGGTYLAINDFAALRADARYFFTPADHPELGRPDNLAFWRVSVGATFTWAIVP